ncbi:hypothetical protein BG006_009097 [Podila minutissima]|uniref:mRNA stability protein n=1 Tax=Podila minutissima TaxID=64525 RepID=A0A9P5SF06_9FUNG|nr:hypothetical protein BG006_009097 [Podila minutissima]
MQSQQDQHLGCSSNNSVMAEQTAKLQSKYGGNVPVFTKSLLGYQNRKYFDSGDYALSKAGKETCVGEGHPQPENIPHSVPVDRVYGSIPTRRGSLANMVVEPNMGTASQTL